MGRLAIMGTGEAAATRHAGRMAKPDGPLMGRGVVRPGQHDDCVTGRHTGQLDGPEGLSAGRGLWGHRVFRDAVRAEPMGHFHCPSHSGHLQIRGVRHCARIPGRSIVEHDARPAQRGRGRV